MQRHSPTSAAIPGSDAPSPPERGADAGDAPASDDGSIRIADLADLPPTVDIETAARILGCGRTLAYDLVKRGEFPCRVLRLGKRYLVPTAALLETLGLHPKKTPHPHGENNRAAVDATRPFRAVAAHGQAATGVPRTRPAPAGVDTHQ